MATFDIVDWSRKKVSSVDLMDEVFATTVKPGLHWEAVKWQQAKRRAGTHSTKVRGEVSGTGRKPFKQKHTGRARAGDFRSPLWRGGAIVFGPRPRSYAYTLPAKVRRGALRSALSMLVRDGNVVIVKDFEGVGGKSRTVLDKVKALGVNRALLVDTANAELKRGARNLNEHKYLAAAGLNVEDLLKFGALVISEQAVRAIEQRLAKK
ncbi:MAG: 50S ribosomal protein L4 [Pseudomonadota bacterium]